MVTRILSKPVLQLVLSELRKRGFITEKLSAGYVVRDAQGVERLRAMNGQRTYLVRYEQDWWIDQNAPGLVGG